MEQRPVWLKTEWVDPATGCRGYLVIDTMINEQCGGGIRMKKGLGISEVERLARTMSYKMIGVGRCCGGAKGGINYDPTAEDSSDVLKRFLEAHKPFLLHCWLTSADLGTKAEDIQSFLSEIGIKSPAHLQKALSFTVDGMKITEVVTGYGLAVAATSALTELEERRPDCPTAAVQGFGNVGGSAALYLERAGFKVVAVADALGTLYEPGGIDVSFLLKNRNRYGEIDRRCLPAHYRQLNREDWLAVDVDVLVPAATADAINSDNVSQIKARYIVEGANIPTTVEAEAELAQKGVVVIPDFMANAGGVGFFGIARNQPVDNPQVILQSLQEQISGMVSRASKRSKSEGITVRAAAIRIIEEKRQDYDLQARCKK